MYAYSDLRETCPTVPKCSFDIWDDVVLCNVYHGRERCPPLFIRCRCHQAYVFLWRSLLPKLPFLCAMEDQVSQFEKYIIICPGYYNTRIPEKNGSMCCCTVYSGRSDAVVLACENLHTPFDATADWLTSSTRQSRRCSNVMLNAAKKTPRNCKTQKYIATYFPHVLSDM